MFSKWMKSLGCLSALVVMTVSGQSQELGYEFGQIVTEDEYGEALDFIETGERRAEAKLPWIPVLSPTMICLDCWVTKTINIHDHYSQQAAERYFAKAEVCADIPLGYEPCGQNLKYTLLAPFYAGCPSLLTNGGFFGWLDAKRGKGGYGMAGAGNYGFQEPIPSIVTEGASGPQLLAPPAAAGSEAMELMPEETGSVSSRPERSPQTASSQGGSAWSRMSDAEILNHFGLDGSAAEGARLAQSLDAPVEASRNWEFAEEARTTQAADLVAINVPTETIVVEEKIVETAQPAVEKTAEVVVKETKTEEFSTTDGEYEKMREIEKDLLSSF